MPRHSFNRGLILKRLGQYELAANSLDAALASRPDSTDIQLSLGLLELLRGHYRDGWRLYAARKSVRESGLERYEHAACRSRQGATCCC